MATIHVTANRTRVLDPEVDNAAMVVVYRGLGPETGKKRFDYDTADWILGQIKKSVSDDLLKQIIFIAPDDYNQDCETSIQQAKKLIDKRGGKITYYSLCGFSKGGRPTYLNLSKRPWRIVGLIDPVSPSMEAMDDTLVDSVKRQIRCVYGVSHWGDAPPSDKKKEAYTKSERVYMKAFNFVAHVKDLGAEIMDIDGDKIDHSEMPALFFKNYASDFV